ncbi:MAG: lysophospholipid acyltransferase family protein [Candidatus Eisenbacteria bacterium]
MGAYYSAVLFSVRSVVGPLSGWTISGRDQVPAKGGMVLASNHISFWDPPLIACAFPREVHFLAKEELFAQKPLGAMIRGVNAIPIRRGVADLSGLQRALDVLQKGGVLLLFPEGSRMRDGELHPPRPGVGLLSSGADVPVMPCFISGSNRPGKWWYRGARVRIRFGPPRGWRELAGESAALPPGRALYTSIGQGVMRDIAALRDADKTAVRGAAETGRSQSS